MLPIPRCCLTLTLACACLPALAQQPAPAADAITRQTGTEPSQKIDWALISVSGRLVPAPGAPSLAVADTTPPRLTAQCTRDAAGKLRFELLADFGGVPEIAYAPPWKQSPGDLYPPHLVPMTMTMDFLGYTKVKPAKRQWNTLKDQRGELEYATPGFGSANMEPIAFYVQYLRALPTLRLSAAGHPTLEFETLKWQAAVKAESLCWASSL